VIGDVGCANLDQAGHVGAVHQQQMPVTADQFDGAVGEDFVRAGITEVLND